MRGKVARFVQQFRTRHASEEPRAIRSSSGRYWCRAITATVVDVALAHPATKTGIGNPEILGDLSGWLLTQPSKLDRTLTELRWVGSGHRNILPEAALAASGSMSANPGEAQAGAPQDFSSDKVEESFGET
jgi:hypothetical protein